MVNVLVVEDSKITREAIVHQLMQMPECSKCGYCVHAREY